MILPNIGGKMKERKKKTYWKICSRLFFLPDSVRCAIMCNLLGCREKKMAGKNINS